MILLKKILWYREDEGYSIGHNLTDALSFDTGNGLEIQNNVLTLNLKNQMTQYRDFGGDIGFQPVGKHAIDDSSSIGMRFNEEDQIKVYLKYSEDASDYISATWNQNNDTQPDNEYLVGVYFITDIGISSGEKSAPIKIVCVDKTYKIFNKIFAKTFITDEGLTTPQLIQKIIQLSAQSSNVSSSTYTGTNNVLYDIKAELVSDGGKIQDTRDDNSAFPVKAMTKVWKPVYEWIKDLSQIDYLNSENELTTNSLVYGRPFIFYVDEFNECHWFEQSDTIDSNLIVGQDNFISHSMTHAVFDVKNMLIFNCGEDMNGHGILDYQLDLTSNIKGLKMQYLPFVNITKDFKTTDYNKYTVKADRKNGGEPFAQYPLDTKYAGGLTTAWSDDNLSDADGIIGESTSDATYNTTLRRAAKVRGKQRARSILSGLANARWKGSAEIYGQIMRAGNLVQFTDTRFGIIEQKLRIHDVKHNVSKQGWFTKITLEEDEQAITAT